MIKLGVNAIRLFIKSVFNRHCSISLKQRISLSTKIVISCNGIINIKKGLHTKRNVTLQSDGGYLEIGQEVFMNEGCIVVSREKITIGDNCSIGPNVMIYDHDHNYKNSMKGYLTTSISIGNNCWIGANSVILRGSKIGNNCVIGAGSIFKGILNDNSSFYQKRESIISNILEKSQGDEFGL